MSPTIRDGRNRVTSFDMTPTTRAPEPVAIVTRARPVLPCERCLHREVCAIRGAIDPVALEVRAPDSPHPALRIGIRIDVECRHFLEGAVAAEPAAARLAEVPLLAKLAAGGPGKPPSQAGYKRTPEQRERMRLGQLAAAARRRASSAGSEAIE